MLPHFHLATIMNPVHEIGDPADFDGLLSAGTPCRETEPELDDLVVRPVTVRPLDMIIPLAKMAVTWFPKARQGYKWDDQKKSRV